VARRGYTFIELLVVVGLLAVILAVLGPRMMRARKVAQANACIGNLKQMQGAKESWALERRASITTQVVWSDITPLLKNGVAPVCPAGGVYTLGVAGTNITCSIPGHLLPAGSPRKFP
jgi:prepilin-type N-terminal cleavage/methylation domain-containing protein